MANIAYEEVDVKYGIKNLIVNGKNHQKLMGAINNKQFTRLNKI